MTTDYVSRMTPPVCEQEPGSVYDRIMTAIHMARKKNSSVFVEKVFKEAYALYKEYKAKTRINLFVELIFNDILDNPTYTPLHGMVIACLYAAFGDHVAALEYLIDNVKDQPGYVHFKPIIDYYRSKRILDNYADKERTAYIRSLEKKEIELNIKLREFVFLINRLHDENHALRESLPSKQENMFTLKDILDYMLSTKKIEFCDQIATMLNHFSRSLTEDGWKQVLAVENELRNGSLINMVNHNHIEGSYVNQGVIKDSKFSKVK